MERVKTLIGNRRTELLEKFLRMGERQFNLFVRKLSGVSAFAGLLYGGSIIGLQLFGLLNLTIWQQIFLLVVPTLAASAFGNFLVRYVRGERRTIRKKQRLEKEKVQNIFDQPSENYRGHGSNW